MQQIALKDVDRLLTSKELKFYNFYNVDIDNAINLSTQHYQNNIEDDPDKVEQKLDVAFVDIEVYQEDKNIKFEFDKSDHPINAITIFNSKTNEYVSFFLLYPFNTNLFNSKPIEEIEKQFIDWMKHEGYLTDQTIKIFTYTDERVLITAAWDYIRNSNPLLLSGFNSDNFDYPYMYRRCLKLFNKEDVPAIFSNFRSVEFRNQRLKISDYPICDIQYLYKPRADGGLNFGQKLASFSLDFIANKELKRKKLEYKDNQGDLNKFYELDPINYLLYNIVDVALCKMLNDKLKHIELLNTLRRLMRIPFSNALIGSSALFEGYTFYTLASNNKKIRFGLVSQNSKTIEASQLKSIPKPTTKKNDIDVVPISQKEYLGIVTKFNGAYVKEPTAQIIKGTVIDLDASLPPWERIYIRRNGKIFWDKIGNYSFQNGDETLTWNKINEVCWKKVLGKVSHPWSKEHGNVLKITTRTGKSVYTTDNHSIFGIQKGINTDTPYIIDAKDLKIGDYVVGFKQFEPDGDKISHNPELLGFWLSDGWASNGTNFYIAKQDKSKLENDLPWIKNSYNEQIGLETITDIEVFEYEGLVYDLSVEETERFFAGTGLGVHNTSLYPSKIIESNIGFDSYRARIINPIIYKVLNQLELHIGIKPLPAAIYNNIYQLVNDFTDRKDISSKLKFKKSCYYTACFLLNKLVEANIPITKIYNPSNDNENYLLQFYLLPLLDIFNTIHPARDVYNNFVFDYLFGNESELNQKFPILYIVNNTNNANQEILRLTTEETINFINKYSLTICGTLFTKHQDYTGLFSEMLIDMAKKRKAFRAELHKYVKGSNEYHFYNSRQLAVKTAMNSSYGAYGLSTFRYSNHWLAESITAQGRLTLKLSQYLTEAFLKQQFENKV